MRVARLWTILSAIPADRQINILDREYGFAHPEFEIRHYPETDTYAIVECELQDEPAGLIEGLSTQQYEVLK